jgi:hypothetical protein
MHDREFLEWPAYALLGMAALAVHTAVRVVR